MQPLRSGIVGTGFMGSVHAQAVTAAGGIVDSVAGSSLASASRLAELLPGATPVGGLDEMLERNLDVIHICTPNTLHFEQALAAIRAGINVVCEKPLATTPAQAAELAKAAAERDTIAAVPFIYRYYPAVREARRRILAESGNDLWLLHGSYLQDWLADPSATNWRVDPGLGGTSRAFGDIGVHWCDLLEFVTGHRIVRINANLTRAFEREGGPSANQTEDGGVLTFETDRGAAGSLVLSQASAGRKNRLWFSFDGPRTSYSFNQEAPEHLWVGSGDEQILVGRNPERHLVNGNPRRGALPPGHPQGYQHCFNDFVADTYDAIRGGAPDGLPTFLDGHRAAVLTQAVTDSAAKGSWVDVPIVGQAAGVLQEVTF
ncbi:Gfo/Idh/MocA family protein [Arthrobacter sp. NPDC058097]|uniref:Gfo/Idh/MocA family protein n=1 Tax=Arthrobacter sp. NPDC058097 TaxID=3346340 RepID=UPI0036D8B0DC